MENMRKSCHSQILNNQMELARQMAQLYDGLDRGKSQKEIKEMTMRIVLSTKVGRNQLLTAKIN